MLTLLSPERVVPANHPLMKHHITEQFFATVVEQARSAELMSDEHFTVDGTLNLMSRRTPGVQAGRRSTDERRATGATRSTSVSATGSSGPLEHHRASAQERRAPNDLEWDGQIEREPHQLSW